MSILAKDYTEKGFRLRLVTSAPSFIHSLAASKQWVMARKPSRTLGSVGVLAGTTSSARLTASFEFIG